MGTSTGTGTGTGLGTGSFSTHPYPGYYYQLPTTQNSQRQDELSEQGAAFSSASNY
ncbi:GH10980 [Drosophila grimshawi]|uniref:GH10980 n=1 Tax=Drosophila grimshawi TaxID=7222 RepID=B4JBM5_DROGR|nr:GH10980 [Drosophila grimshawi]